MPKPTSGWLSLVAALLLTACGGSSAPSSGDTAKSAVASVSSATEGQETTRFNSVDALVWDADPQKSGAGDKSPVIQVSVEEKAGLRPTTTVDLGSPDATQLEQRIRNNRESTRKWAPKAYQTGFARPAAPTETFKHTHSMLKWAIAESGTQRARIRFTSSGAKAVRLGILVENIPDTTVFRVYAEGSTTAQQTTGEHINRLIRANKLKDGDSQASRTYWTAATTGGKSVLEIEVPRDSDTESLLFAIPTINHQVETALEANNALIGAKATCSLTPDATCTMPLPPAANAVAAMDFIDGGYSYTCTGTLIANRGDTQQNYFLTANHCINTQNVASSLATQWFWRSSECNGTTPFTGTLTQPTGSIFLFGRTAFSGTTRNPIGTDTTLLKLNAQPPIGVVYAGWQHLRRAADSSTPYIGLHHPFDAAIDRQYSDFLRRSDSQLVNYGILLGVAQDGYYLLDARNNASYPMYEVRHTSGITEPGSSGSALFSDGLGPNPRIIGQLWGGSSSCENPGGKDYYGRFDLAYEDGLVNWLNPGYKFVFRFYRPNNGTHFFSASVEERDSVRINNTYLSYEGPAFMVASASGSGLSPVHRFLNRYNGTHFYTISDSERASVVANLSHIYVYEGVAWYTRDASVPVSGMVNVHRFYRKSAGTHLYTASDEEKDYIIANYSANYTYEGVAYLAWAPN